jgi:signal transduction histidine kinase
VIPLAVITAVLLDAPLSRALLVTQLFGIWGFALAAAERWPTFGTTALVPDAGEHLSAEFYYYHAGFLTLALIVVAQVGRRVSVGCTAILRRHLESRHELLKANSDRVRELTSLSAEIAHELKNPLASVKGLSALLAQNVTDGKGAERLRVLRQEVDRMQSVLEEFLNFSRPLVPLALVNCDAADIVRDVVALHEGLAQQKRVQLSSTELTATPLRSDPRKVKQILINLIQNALDASPPESNVTLTTEAVADKVMVRIADEGPGLDPELNVFDPGVTSKAGGAGLGLTIARALARQHGGELELASDAGGGAVATLTLPKEASASQPA